jgi:hypothetical protein
MSKMTVREWAVRQREGYLARRERALKAKRIETHIRYGIRATEMARVVNYIDAHPPKPTDRREGVQE